MSDDSLIRALPDLVMFIRPDGLILDHFGGRTLPFPLGGGDLAGRRVQELLEPAAHALILRLVRRVIADRDSCEAAFKMDDADYRVRIHPHGPERAVCVLRHIAADRPPAPSADPHSGSADGFVGQLLDAASAAGLRERTFALCLVFLGGLPEIGELIDFSIGQQILAAVLQRLRAVTGTDGDGAVIVGTLGDMTLGVIVTEGSRDRMRAGIESIAAGLAEPVHVNDATFVLSPHIGVAVFGQDSSDPQTLLDLARAAMLEARRAGPGSIQFYSDTMRMLPVLRLDIERELREAIQDGQIKLTYLSRHHLITGQLTGMHAYMRWVHPLRGEIAPAQFLRIAETTNLAPAVSRAALERLALDLPQLRRRFAQDFPISFAPLRHHVSNGEFLTDLLRSSHSGRLTAGGLQLRIAERTLAAMSEPGRILGDLQKAGVGCVIDEMGSGASSLPQLAQLPMAALQITRRFVVAAVRDAQAMRTCRSIAALAGALEVPAIAPGVDDDATRALMARIGCAEGLGDLYPAEVRHHSSRRIKAGGAAAP